MNKKSFNSVFFGNSPTSYIHTCLEVPISRTTDLSSKYNPYAFSVSCNLNSYIFKRQTLYHWLFIFFFKPLAQMDRHVGYICVQFWLMRKFILDISLYRFMVLLCSYTESKLSHFFFSGKSKVKCNYIVMFITYSAFFFIHA